MSTGTPIPTYRFLVRVGDDEMAFNSVSGLELSSDDNTSGTITPLNISLKSGIIMRQSQLYDWFNSIHHEPVEKKDISICLTNETGSEVMVTWNVINAFPTKLTAPSSAANDVSIGELCLTADNLTITYS